MIEQLNSMNFTVFKEDVKGAANAMISGTAYGQHFSKGVTNKWYRAHQHCGCDKYHSRI